MESIVYNMPHQVHYRTVYHWMNLLDNDSINSKTQKILHKWIPKPLTLQYCLAPVMCSMYIILDHLMHAEKLYTALQLIRRQVPLWKMEKNFKHVSKISSSLRVFNLLRFSFFSQGISSTDVHKVFLNDAFRTEIFKFQLNTWEN